MSTVVENKPGECCCLGIADSAIVCLFCKFCILEGKFHILFQRPMKMLKTVCIHGSVFRLQHGASFTDRTCFPTKTHKLKKNNNKQY